MLSLTLFLSDVEAQDRLFLFQRVRHPRRDRRRRLEISGLSLRLCSTTYFNVYFGTKASLLVPVSLGPVV